MLQKTASAKISSFPITRSFSYFGIWRSAEDHSQVFKKGGGMAPKGGDPPILCLVSLPLDSCVLV